MFNFIYIVFTGLEQAAHFVFAFLYAPLTLPASNEFCPLLITFANGLDPDQDRHVGPDLVPNRFTL